MTFDAHAIGSFYTETFDAGFADTPDHESMNIIGSYSVTGEKWQTFEALVEVDKAADYHLGIRHSTLTTMRDELHIDNLQLLPFISTAAPASVDNLSVTLLPDNPLKGSLAFTAPVKAINGQPITEITKIEVMRGATILAEITDATPGKQFSMEVDVPQGVQEFNVICHNWNGRGHDLAFIVWRHRHPARCGQRMVRMGSGRRCQGNHPLGRGTRTRCPWHRHQPL